MKYNNTKIPEGWKLTSFGETDLFRIIGSGIKQFYGEKEFYSTSSIDGNRVLFAEQLITFKNRPSRANMQPIENSVWFAKMKNTFKILKAQKKEIEEVILSTGFCGIESKIVDCDYLMQILSSTEFNNQKNLLAEGSTQEAVNNTKIKDIKFLIPEFQNEQIRIAQILSKTDSAIVQTEALIVKYQSIKTGLIQDFLTNGIDEDGNIRNENIHTYKTEMGCRVPDSWEVCYLGKYVRVQGGNSFKSSDFVSEGIQLIRIGNLYNNNLDLKRDPIYLPLEYRSIYSNFLLNEGDIVMSMTGTYGKRDYGFAIMMPPGSNYLLNQRVCKFILSDNIDSDFLLLILRSENYLEQLFNSVTGSKQANLNNGNILNAKIRLPNINEQKVIVSKIKSIDSYINNLNSELIKYKSIKKGLMNDLLSGKIRLTQAV